jgi:hypothetical protein
MDWWLQQRNSASCKSDVTNKKTEKMKNSFKKKWDRL